MRRRSSSWTASRCSPTRCCDGRVAHLSGCAATRRSDLDAVLLSHLHADHLDFRSLAAARRTSPVVVPAALGRVRPPHPARSSSSRGDGRSRDGHGTGHAGGAREQAASVRATVAADGLVVAGSSTVYFAGDTDLFPEMVALAPLDVALLPVAGWGPTLPPPGTSTRPRRRGRAPAAPRIAIPIHWGTYGVIGSRGAAVLNRRGFRREVARAATDAKSACCIPERDRRCDVGAAFFWGSLAASSLVLGGVLALAGPGAACACSGSSWPSAAAC